MKYSSSNKPLVCMMTNSTCYLQTEKMAVKGVLWHSTGANNPNLKRYVQPSKNDPNYNKLMELLGDNAYNNDWNHISIEAGLNAWIGKLANETVAAVQTMPWDYRPWGCGTGAKGSCNDGWIQFEICEDGLTDKNYFNAIYKEACELTAYLCALYDLDPLGTVSKNGQNVPVILCHKDSFDYGLGSGHVDVMHWFSKHGKTMKDVRNDVAELMGLIKPTPTELYRIRKSWDNAASQIGAYSVLENAINACKAAGPEYKVYDSKGKQVYPEVDNKPANTGYKAGQKINLNKAPLYASSTAATPVGTKTGTFYLWDNTVTNGRIRITVDSKYVGQANGVTGWINTSSIGTVVETKPTTNTNKPTNTTTTNKPAVSYKAGQKITLKNANLYTSATATSKVATKTGTFYLWDSQVVNNRIRITINASYVGKANGITGWIDVSAIGVDTNTTTTKPTIKAGAKITLNKAPLYISSSSKTKIATKTGTFYLWDAKIVNNKIRITTKANWAGKALCITGWIDVSSIG